SAIFAEQVIDRQRKPWAKTRKICCSADQVYSHRRQCADNWRPSCSCAAKSAGRMASNIAIGALSRTPASPAGAWYSGMCCIWVRSTIRRNWRGAGRSRFWRMARRGRGHGRCFRTRPAGATGATRRAGQALGARRRALCPGAKPRSRRQMRRRQLKRLWARLKQLSMMRLTREELLMKLGAARDQSRTAWRLVTIEMAAEDAAFSYRLDRSKLRQTQLREGPNLLRTNLT